MNAVLLWLGLALPSGSPVKQALPPWKVNPPIVTVKKELYRKHPRQGSNSLVWTYYVGPGLERVELHSSEAESDVWTERKRRFSPDNGKTWSAFTPLASTNYVYKGIISWEAAWGDPVYDPASGLLVASWNRQLLVHNKWQMFAYYVTSKDHGRTWSKPHPLRYEPGEDFDPQNPLNPRFLRKNQAQPGYWIKRLQNGNLILPAGLANASGDHDNDNRAWKMGALCWVGRWDATKQEYHWTAGKRVETTPEISSRGLFEAEADQLQDGRVLVVWRGSDTPKTPGRKWFSLSTDDGLTLSPPQEWRYDDGTRFYSPSSFHRFIRHSVTGKLYWLGNLCAQPPRGNSPRYPLVIAEVDEQKAALKKNTVTAIDDRQPGQTAVLQFSNFALLENRETHDLELYMTLYGNDTNDERNADSYKYTVTLKESVRLQANQK